MKIRYPIIIFILFMCISFVSCKKENEPFNEPEHIHSFLPADCYSPKTCSECGETEGEPKSHDFKCIIELLPTCTEDGEIDYECTLCHGTKFVIVPKLDHLFDDETPKRCEICHMVEGENMIPKSEPKYDELIQMINEYIPDVISENITFPTKLENSSAKIYFTTSNDEIINSNGLVFRNNEDQKVTITCNIIFNKVQYNYHKEVVVPKLELKSMENKKIVVAYLYPSSLEFANKEDIQKIDQINYSFGTIVGNRVVIPDVNKFKRALTYHNYGTRISLAIGGWGAGGFSNSMLTEDGRKALASSIMDLIKKYNLDGIDIDWEYPTSGVAGIDYSSSDRDNLTMFCKLLYPMMKSYRSDLHLTMAVVPNNNFFDFKSLTPYIDYFNLMTYDYAMGNTALHHTNLSSTSGTSIEKNVRTILDYVPANKVVIGAAFYGRHATFASENKCYLGAPLLTNLASMSYTEIKEKIEKYNWTVRWDENAQAPYIIEGMLFITFDNPQSVACKAQYVLDNNLGGIMFWELSQDRTGDLVTSIYNTLNKIE